MIFSADGGATFGSPVRADAGVPLGRVDVELVDEGSALVSWIEHNNGRPEFRARRVGADGTRGASRAVSPMSGERSSGSPRMVRIGDEVVFAWRATGPEARVRTAVARIADTTERTSATKGNHEAHEEHEE